MPSPTPVNNAVNWTNDWVSLTATNFYLNIEGKGHFTGNPQAVVRSDYGNPNESLTLEVSWPENDVEMRLYIYFRKNVDNTWTAYNINSYNGEYYGDWIYYDPLQPVQIGSAFTESNVNWYSTDGKGHIHFENLNLFPFKNLIPTVTPSPAPTPRNNAVNWSTPYVSLSATNFYLNIDNNNLFISNPTINVHSDPGDDNYTSLELSWNENDVNMFMTLYFKMLNGMWKVSEVRTSDGVHLGQALYYPEFGNSPKGSPYTVNNFNLVSNDGRGKIHFENLNLSAFMPIDLPISQYGYALEPKPLTDQNNRIIMNYGPNGGSSYGVNVVLRDVSYKVITDQSQFYYNIDTSNSSVVGGTLGTLDYGNNTCAYGIQSPCPYNHVDLIAYGLGKETITINVYMQNGTKIASANFYVDVRSSGIINPTPTGVPTSAECQMCGGIAGILCQSGLTCKMEASTYADQSGICVKSDNTSVCSTTPTPSPLPKIGDANGDGHVNMIDIGAVVDYFDVVNPENPKVDIDGDGKVTLLDIGLIIDNYEW